MQNNSIKRSWMEFLAILIIVFGTPALFRSVEQPSFDYRTLEELKFLQPEYVLIGNSMLETRIDARHLSRLLGGRKVAVLHSGGDMSSIWYLRLKNHVAASGSKPKAVFIFFRDDELTKPLNRIRGMYEKKIQSLKRGEEREFDDILEANLPLDYKSVSLVKNIYPEIADAQDKRRESLNAMAMDPFVVANISQLWTRPRGKNDVETSMLRSQYEKDWSLARDSFKREVNEIFAYSKLRKTRNADVSKKRAAYNYDFGNVEKTFLPAMIKTASENGLKLVFVRVQKRPGPNGPLKDPPSLERYVAELRDYIENHGMIMYDFSGDPQVTLEMYQDGDHIAERYKRAYTELFYFRLAGVFN